ncbi:MAG: hypothetical protein J7M19_07825 [Planctomycetes bacterium]|nr:hypothetical protein [Planctomycetota bacterium]
MNEKNIWRIVLWTIAATGLVLLVASFDSGTFNLFIGGNVIPVSTGKHIEMVIIRGSSLRGSSLTDLYRLGEDDSFEKVTTFQQAPQCVTGLDGKLFITFSDGQSSFFDDGKWVRGVSAPRDLKVIDVAGYEGRIHAIGLTDDKHKLSVAVLGDEGWQKTAEPFDAGKVIRFRGCIDVEGGIEVLYVAGPVDVVGRPDPDKAHWYHVLFDGRKWGEERPIDIPPRMIPVIASYEGQLALCLMPLDRNAPVTITLPADGKPEPIAEVPPPEKGRAVTPWLVQVAGKYRMILCGADKVWEVPLENLKPGAPHLLMATGAGARIRAHVYVVLLSLGSVLLVSLGVTWLVMRVRTYKRARRG